MSTHIRVLLVEDNVYVRRSLGHAFDFHDAITLVAAVSTLREARQTLGSECVDVILTDLNLEDGQGVELATSSPGIGLVLMTGESLGPDTRSTYAALGFSVLDKPFAADVCYDAILAASQASPTVSCNRCL